MRRLLSALLMVIVLVSHGSMGTAAPHADDSAHAMGALEHHAEADSDRAGLHADAADIDSASGEDTIDKGAPSAAHHVHLMAAFVPDSDLRFAPSFLEKGRLRPRDDASLRSANLEPLPEPPAA